MSSKAKPKQTTKKTCHTEELKRKQNKQTNESAFEKDPTNSSIWQLHPDGETKRSVLRWRFPGFALHCIFIRSLY